MAERPTPRTDALIRRHTQETGALSPEIGLAKTREHSLRQVKEFLEHARQLERDRSELAEALLGIIDGLKGIQITPEQGIRLGIARALLRRLELGE